MKGGFEPEMCGGTSSSFDDKAPKTILSEEMTFFSATSSFSSYANRPIADKMKRLPLAYLSAFAAKVDGGCFLLLDRCFGNRRFDKTERDWGIVKEDVFPALAELVKEHDLAKGNGSYSYTHGLPEDFGGSVDIRYASGEKIGFSNNQVPILHYGFALSVMEIFTKAFRGERVQMPDLAGLKQVIYEEKRKNGGFTKAILSLKEDGTGDVERSIRFDDPKVYEEKDSIDKETVLKIKGSITNSGILAWAGLPYKGFMIGNEESLTFIFAGGNEITVTDDRLIPGQLHGSFFEIHFPFSR